MNKIFSRIFQVGYHFPCKVFINLVTLILRFIFQEVVYTNSIIYLFHTTFFFFFFFIQICYFIELLKHFLFIFSQHYATILSSSLAKGYDPLYSSSPLASLDGFSRSHSDGLYVMQLMVAATNQKVLYKKSALQKAHVLQEKCQQNKNACTYKIML